MTGANNMLLVYHVEILTDTPFAVLGLAAPARSFEVDCRKD
jgi:hypothetical protein